MMDTAGIKRTHTLFRYGRVAILLCSMYMLFATGCEDPSTRGQERMVVDSLLSISAAYKDAQPDSSRYYAMMALIKAEDANDAIGAGEAYNRLGYYYRLLDSLDEAKAAYLLALDHLIQTDSNALIAKASSGLGVTFKEQGIFDSAVFFLQQAVDYAEASGDQLVVANYLNNLANAFDRFSSYADACRYHHEALAIRWSIHDTAGILMSYNNLASVYYNWHQFDSALFYNDLSLYAFPTALSKLAYANAHNNTALTLAAMMQYDSARAHYFKALAVYELTGNKIDHASVLSNIGISYLMQERYQDALDYLLPSDSMAIAMGLRTLHAKNKRNIAMSEYGTGAFMQAVMSYDSAILYQDTLLDDYRTQLRSFADMQTKLQEEKLRYAFELENQRTKNIRNIVIAAAAVALLLLVFYFNRRQLKKQLEFERALETDRRRISADLHDEVGSALGSLSYYTQMVQQPHTVLPDVDKGLLLDRIREIASESIENLSDIVWMVNPANDTIGSLIGRMNNYASDLLAAKMVKYSMYMDPALDAVQLSMPLRKSLYLVFKEAVYNVSKYASADQVDASVTLQDGRVICMTVRDNGIGFNPEALSDKSATAGGNGLTNMKARIHEVGGDFHIISAPGMGTTIKIEVSLSA